MRTTATGTSHGPPDRRDEPDEQRDDDIVFESHGLRLLVDGPSLPYVDGSTIDYVDSLQGAGFQVVNPNVTAACGCGSSFRVADDDEVSAV